MGQEGRALEATSDRFVPAEPKEGSLQCAVVGCPRRTSDRKPFCLDHLHMNTYAGKVMAEVRGMSDAEILGPPDPYAPKRQRRRDVVPIELQVGTRFWVGLVRARGIEKDPEPSPPTNPRRLRAEFSTRVRPFTRLLDRNQSRYVLLLLQEHRAERVPPGWLVDDRKLVAELLKKFSSSPPEVSACTNTSPSPRRRARAKPGGSSSPSPR